jgi:hypothetical protein
MVVSGGVKAESLDTAIDWGIDFIGGDAGSTDLGPYVMAGKGSMASDMTYRRDLALLLRAARKVDVPLIIGTSAGAGTDADVERFAQMIRDVAAEDSLSFRMAKIFTDVDNDYMVDALSAGTLSPLNPSDDLSEEILRRNTHTVAMMGAEQFTHALEGGASVIIGGRASDAAIFSTVPMRAGIDPGVAWHAGKTAECGAVAAYPPSGDCLYVSLDESSFTVTPPDPSQECSVISVAAQQLYESSDPYLLVQPSGVLDTTEAHYTAVDQRSVRCAGARFHPAERYTIKLESVWPVGHQKFFMMSVRDPAITESLSEWLESLREPIERKLTSVLGPDAAQMYEMTERIYGHDGTMGAWEREKYSGHEAFFLVDVVARTPEIAETVAGIVWYTYLHQPTPKWKGYVTLAVPFSPQIMDLGTAYRFGPDCVVEPSDPLDPFRFEYEEVGR